MKMTPTTIDRKARKKWLTSSTFAIVLALLLVLSSLPVYAGEQQTEQTETPTVTQDAGSESAQSETSSEQNEPFSDELEPVQPIAPQEPEIAATDWTQEKPHEGQVLHGGYVGFKNVDTGKYLTISCDDTTSETNNVYMQGASSIPNAQEFYLEYVYDVTANKAFFQIYSVTSTGASARIVRSSSSSMYKANVRLFTKNVLNMTERWQIEHVGGNYYCIYLASTPDTTGTRYALTATTGEGSEEEDTVMSSGNAIVDVYTGIDSQLWEICADGKPVNINGYDITQGGSQETIIGTSIVYYYIPKTFNTIIDWNMGDSDFVTSTEFGVVTPTQYGQINVILRISNSAILSHYFSTTLYSLPQANKVVYFSNAGTGRYIDIEGPSKANDAIIQQWDYSTSSTRKWRVYHDSYSVGYIRLRSVYSTKYLAVDPNDNSIVEQTNAS
ncbi:MAG: RICIN domain-containing protein, partial [Clostridia bacterium]|nr:RICIN domain-containing protein [Clostridia bacterium]